MTTQAPALRARHGAAAKARVLVVYVAIFFVALPALLWGLGGRFDALLALEPIDSAAARALGAVVAAGGLVFMAWSMLSLSLRGRGLPVSHLPPAELVQRGPHARMRHPIYVGYLALFAGCGIAAGSWGRGVLAASLLLAGSILYALGFEEPRLRARFGDAYRAYAERVPAFPAGHAFARAVLRMWRVARPFVERLANRVVLFRVGPAVLVTYGAFGALGTAVALAFCHALLRAFVSARDEALYLGGLALWMVFLARLLALVYQPRLLVTSPLEALRRVGFVSWGGYLGMFTFPFLFARFASYDPWWLLDRTFLPALACSALGRVGCLTYGCCYGRASREGIAWTHPEAKPNREKGAHGCVRRIPTQLFSVLSVAALVPIVAPVLQRSTPGASTMIGALLYSIARFGVEQTRDEVRFAGLTRGQFVALFGAATATALLFAPARAPALVQRVEAPESALAWVAVLAGSLVVFLVCGVHVRRVGRW